MFWGRQSLGDIRFRFNNLESMISICLNRLRFDFSFIYRLVWNVCFHNSSSARLKSIWLCHNPECCTLWDAHSSGFDKMHLKYREWEQALGTHIIWLSSSFQLYSTFQHLWTHYVSFIIFQLYCFSPLSSFASMFFPEWNFPSKSSVHYLLIGPAAEQNELVNRCWADKLSACKLTCSTYQHHQLIVCQCLQLVSLRPKSSFLIPDESRIHLFASSQLHQASL